MEVSSSCVARSARCARLWAPQLCCYNHLSGGSGGPRGSPWGNSPKPSVNKICILYYIILYYIISYYIYMYIYIYIFIYIYLYYMILYYIYMYIFIYMYSFISLISYIYNIYSMSIYSINSEPCIPVSWVDCRYDPLGAFGAGVTAVWDTPTKAWRLW